MILTPAPPSLSTLLKTGAYIEERVGTRAVASKASLSPVGALGGNMRRRSAGPTPVPASPDTQDAASPFITRSLLPRGSPANAPARSPASAPDRSPASTPAGRGSGSSLHNQAVGGSSFVSPPQATAACPQWELGNLQAVALVKATLVTSADGVSGGALCREKERAQVLTFCQSCLEAGKPGSMYVSGVPGTGKSLTLRELEATVGAWREPPLIASVNCMELGDPRAVFVRIIEALGGHMPAAARGSRNHSGVIDQFPEVAVLRNLLTQQPAAAASKRKRVSSGGGGACGPRALILVDELDILVGKSPAVLYELFALPTHRGARCVLVGAANTINLIETVLPRLRLANCEPALACFPAYTVQQLLQLLRSRLEPLPWRVFDAGALELCARRVAAASGDMRRALLAACAAIDVAVQKAAESREQPSQPDGPPAKPSTGLVGMVDMKEALTLIFKSPVVDTIRDLERDHKLVLCAAVLLFRGSERKETTVGELLEAYTALCHREHFTAVLAHDFCTLCSALADYALMTCSGGARLGLDRRCRIMLCANEEDVVLALQDTTFAHALGE